MVLAELGSSITAAISKATNLDDASSSGTTTQDPNDLSPETVKTLINEISRALLKADVNVALLGQLTKGIEKAMKVDKLPKGYDRRKLLRVAVYNELVKMVDPGIEPFKPKKGQTQVIMFVGLQGSGKTTSITKYARWYARKGYRCAIVCADTFRAGAFDQLKQNATKVNIPFYGSYTETDPVKLARDGVEQFRKEKYELIIVDTSGRHRQDENLFQEMKQIENVVAPEHIIFVMDSSIGQAAESQARAFKNVVSVGSVILTKLDGHAQGGGALSAVAATKSPIVFIGVGEHFDDLQEFEPNRFVQRLLGYGDIVGLANRVQEVIDPKKSAQMVTNLAQGSFTLRDMRDLLQTIMNLGPLSQVLGMLPANLTQGMDGMADLGQAQMKKYMTIMDSMTNTELDEVDIQKIPNKDSRMRRIALGSGSTIQDVQGLFAGYKKFKKLGSMLKKFGMDKLMSNVNSGEQPSMKDMSSMQQMMQGMGLGGLSRGAGGMPNLNNMSMGNIQQMMQQMGLGPKQRFRGARK
eukprot:CAMPEP_0117446276 /NCGR_PEP_ID=MMETSP0759-20121206/6250_1 /TAXON_ID=63605 /ORGANISM="Percolomonas cosmopolitus, Strain WS" /LENGTH=522 /DNA_ID=CAMNT_0005238523 /DNA_START=106 /DNA_END=1674 /DNA_ORIENTATION=-